ncbi:D-glycero-beta-D-manno-heptose-7-phosphate kinase [Sphingobium nicotianae]|uniref:D-glycero-beta-D-manno-heptose-7-phosphate kinase n=1 Tax=Sphingobium nicotianae TaxID=2782607 RepID=UPI0032D98470
MAFNGTRVVVIGDALLDCYEIGEVIRISPEAPVPVVLHQDRRSVPGGAANVAMNCATLGADVTLIYVAGNDAAAEELTKILARGNIDSRVVLDASRSTSIKTRVVAGTQQLLRLDRETTAPIGPKIEDALLAAFESVINCCDTVLLSDYCKGSLTDRVLEHVIARAHSLGVPCLVDPKRKDFSSYAGATLIKPNLGEFEAVVGHTCNETAQIEEAAAKLCHKLGSDLLVTRSSKGMSLLSRDAEPVHLAARAFEVFDVSGAGDTVLATLGVALAGRWEMAKAMALANVAAGIVVQKAGTATLAIDELNEAILADHAVALPGGSVVDWEEARKRCQDWQKRGLKVGFTNGCFDLLHPGHVRSIHAAASHCDRLVVAINSDASVRRLKGATRPVQSEQDRAEIMAALSQVALVIIFDEDTPFELIAYLEPDVLVKGADYREEDVAGGDIVKARGGRIVLVPILEGRSTSKLVERSRA